MFPTVGTAGTDAKTPTSTPPRAPTVAPLTLNISGDASVAQKALTRKREDEKATKAAAAAAARAAARARRVGAQTRRGNVRTPIARVDRRGSVFAFVAFAHDPTEISESRFVRRVPTAHASRRVRVRVRLRAPARAGGLSRRAEFSDALAVKRRRAEARRPTMAYGELCPLNATREKATFLRAYERYKSGLDVAMPPIPCSSTRTPKPRASRCGAGAYPATSSSRTPSGSSPDAASCFRL